MCIERYIDSFVFVFVFCLQLQMKIKILTILKLHIHIVHKFMLTEFLYLQCLLVIFIFHHSINCSLYMFWKKLWSSIDAQCFKLLNILFYLRISLFCSQVGGNRFPLTSFPFGDMYYSSFQFCSLYIKILIVFPDCVRCLIFEFV